MKLRLVGAIFVVALVTACGSEDGSGTRESISLTTPTEESITESVPAVEQPPVETAAPEEPPAETPAPETAPPETAPPETAAPETAPPETAAPETVPAEQVPTDTTPTEDGTDDGTVWWPWVLVAIALIGLIAAVVVRSRKKTAGTWHAQVTALLDEVDGLTRYLPGLTPDALLAVAGTDATKLATMRATLQQLVTAAPDVASQTSLGRLTEPMAQLHGALNGISLAGQSVLPGGVTAAQLAVDLHTASAAVRAAMSLTY